MKLTMSKMVDAHASLEKFSMVNNLPIRIGIPFSKLLRKSTEVYQDFISLRNKLVKEYGECVDEKTQAYKVLDTEKEGVYKKEYEELCNSEIEVEFEKVGIIIDEFERRFNINFNEKKDTKQTVPIVDLTNLEVYINWK